MNWALEVLNSLFGRSLNDSFITDISIKHMKLGKINTASLNISELAVNWLSITSSLPFLVIF